MTPEFWHGKHVFLTGHTGFKGAWLSLWLQSLGAKVTGYAMEPETQPNLFDLARVAEGMASHVIADIRDAKILAAALTAAQPEIVLHMAAQPLVRHSYVDPVGTYATNVMGTVHLLEAVRMTAGIKAVVIVTTDKCYENREWHWGYRENEPMGGHDPYSNSKGCAELVTQAYRDSFFRSSSNGPAVASARAGNVIGGGDWAADRLIPDLIRGACEKREVALRNPQAIRPWQHVLEPLGGYLTLAEKLYEQGNAFAEGWNFGPYEADAKPVGWIADRMVALWPQALRWTRESAPQPHEATYLKLDCSKARARLDWSPRWNLDQALTQIVTWHRAHLTGTDMRKFTLEQIASYPLH